MTSEFQVNDYVWGMNMIDIRYLKMFELIGELKCKRQLGLAYRNQFITGGNHTRYEHSIGTFIVGTKFLEACKKFETRIKITEQEKVALLLSLLFHDSGHGPYSHAFERLSKVTHEEQTIKQVKKMKNIIDNTFGKGTCKIVIAILANSYNIKKELKKDTKNCSEEIDVTNLGLIFVLSALLSGAIDIDRIDYLSRDLLSVTGEKKDFTKIFDYMELSLVDDKPRIVFDKKAITLLEDYFLQRFRNYNDIYFHEWTNILDKYFEWFVTETFSKDKITAELSERDIDDKIAKGPYSSYKSKRCAEVLEGRGSENVLYRYFESENDMEVFISKLNMITPMKDYFFAKIVRKVVIYDSKKNNVLIQVGDLVIDFYEASKIIKDKISQEKLAVIVDLDLLAEKLKDVENPDRIQDILKSVKKVFSESNYEIEKKFLFRPEDAEKIENLIRNIGYEKFSTYCIVNSKKELQYHFDKYFAFDGMPDDISIRSRNDEEEPYTLKLPASDSTSLTKRNENKFSKYSSLDEFLKISREIISSSGYEVTGPIEYLLSIDTERKKYDVYINDSKLEVAIDSSKYSCDGSEDKFDWMLEIELKTGNPIDLWIFVKQLKKSCELEPCKESKVTRAKKALGK